MVQKKTVALLAAACLTTGWIVASVVSPPVATTQPRAARVQPQARQQAEAPFTERLDLKLKDAPEPPEPRRNPFVFGRRGEEPARRDDAPPVLTFTPAPELPRAPEGPSLELTGIAADEGPEGVVRTAVLSDGRDVYLLKAGDRVGGYTIVRVDEKSVLLAEDSGRQVTLRLR